MTLTSSSSAAPSGLPWRRVGVCIGVGASLIITVTYSVVLVRRRLSKPTAPQPTPCPRAENTIALLKDLHDGPFCFGEAVALRASTRDQPKRHRRHSCLSMQSRSPQRVSRLGSQLLPFRTPRELPGASGDSAADRSDEDQVIRLTPQRQARPLRQCSFLMQRCGSQRAPRRLHRPVDCGSYGEFLSPALSHSSRSSSFGTSDNLSNHLLQSTSSFDTSSMTSSYNSSSSSPASRSLSSGYDSSPFTTREEPLWPRFGPDHGDSSSAWRSRQASGYLHRQPLPRLPTGPSPAYGLHGCSGASDADEACPAEYRGPPLYGPPLFETEMDVSDAIAEMRRVPSNDRVGGSSAMQARSSSSAILAASNTTFPGGGLSRHRHGSHHRLPSHSSLRRSNIGSPSVPQLPGPHPSSGWPSSTFASFYHQPQGHQLSPTVSRAPSQLLCRGATLTPVWGTSAMSTGSFHGQRERRRTRRGLRHRCRRWLRRQRRAARQKSRRCSFLVRSSRRRMAQLIIAGWSQVKVVLQGLVSRVQRSWGWLSSPPSPVSGTEDREHLPSTGSPAAAAAPGAGEGAAPPLPEESGVDSTLNAIVECLRSTPGRVPTVAVIRAPLGYDVSTDADNLWTALQLDSTSAEEGLIDIVILEELKTEPLPPVLSPAMMPLTSFAMPSMTANAEDPEEPNVLPSSEPAGARSPPTHVAPAAPEGETTRLSNGSPPGFGSDGPAAPANPQMEHRATLKLSFELYPAHLFYSFLFRAAALQEKDSALRRAAAALYGGSPALEDAATTGAGAATGIASPGATFGLVGGAVLPSPGSPVSMLRATSTTGFGNVTSSVDNVCLTPVSTGHFYRTPGSPRPAFYPYGGLAVPGGGSASTSGGGNVVVRLPESYSFPALPLQASMSPIHSPSMLPQQSGVLGSNGLTCGGGSASRSAGLCASLNGDAFYRFYIHVLRTVVSDATAPTTVTTAAAAPPATLDALRRSDGGASGWVLPTAAVESSATAATGTVLQVCPKQADTEEHELPSHGLLLHSPLGDRTEGSDAVAADHPSAEPDGKMSEGAPSVVDGSEDEQHCQLRALCQFQEEPQVLLRYRLHVYRQGSRSQGALAAAQRYLQSQSSVWEREAKALLEALPVTSPSAEAAKTPSLAATLPNVMSLQSRSFSPPLMQRSPLLRPTEVTPLLAPSTRATGAPGGLLPLSIPMRDASEPSEVERQLRMPAWALECLIRRESMRETLVRDLKERAFRICAIPLPDMRVYRTLPPAVPRYATAHARGFSLSRTFAEEILSQQRVLQYILLQKERENQERLAEMQLKEERRRQRRREKGQRSQQRRYVHSDRGVDVEADLRHHSFSSDAVMSSAVMTRSSTVMPTSGDLRDGHGLLRPQRLQYGAAMRTPSDYDMGSIGAQFHRSPYGSPPERYLYGDRRGSHGGFPFGFQDDSPSFMRAPIGILSQQSLQTPPAPMSYQTNVHGAAYPTAPQQGTNNAGRQSGGWTAVHTSTNANTSLTPPPALNGVGSTGNVATHYGSSSMLGGAAVSFSGVYAGGGFSADRRGSAQSAPQLTHLPMDGATRPMVRSSSGGAGCSPSPGDTNFFTLVATSPSPNASATTEYAALSGSQTTPHRLSPIAGNSATMPRVPNNSMFGTYNHYYGHTAAAPRAVELRHHAQAAAALYSTRSTPTATRLSSPHIVPVMYAQPAQFQTRDDALEEAALAMASSQRPSQTRRSTSGFLPYTYSADSVSSMYGTSHYPLYQYPEEAINGSSYGAGGDRATSYRGIDSPADASVGTTGREDPRNRLRLYNLHLADLLGVAGGPMRSGISFYYTYGNATACLYNASLNPSVDEDILELLSHHHHQSVEEGEASATDPAVDNDTAVIKGGAKDDGTAQRTPAASVADRQSGGATRDGGMKRCTNPNTAGAAAASAPAATKGVPPSLIGIGASPPPAGAGGNNDGMEGCSYLSQEELQRIENDLTTDEVAQLMAQRERNSRFDSIFIHLHSTFRDIISHPIHPKSTNTSSSFAFRQRAASPSTSSLTPVTAALGSNRFAQPSTAATASVPSAGGTAPSLSASLLSMWRSFMAFFSTLCSVGSSAAFPGPPPPAATTAAVHHGASAKEAAAAGERVITYGERTELASELDVSNGHYGLTPFQVWLASRYSRRFAAEVYLMDVVAARGDPFYPAARVLDEVVAHAVLYYNNHSLREFAEDLESKLGLRYVPQTQWGRCAMGLANADDEGAEELEGIVYTAKCRRVAAAMQTMTEQKRGGEDGASSEQRASLAPTVLYASPRGSESEDEDSGGNQTMRPRRGYEVGGNANEECSTLTPALSDHGKTWRWQTLLEDTLPAHGQWLQLQTDDEDEDESVFYGALHAAAAEREATSGLTDLNDAVLDREAYDEKMLLRELDHLKDFLIEHRNVLMSAMLTPTGSNCLEAVFGVPATVFPFLLCARESVPMVWCMYESLTHHYGPLFYDAFARYAHDVFQHDRADLLRHTPRMFRLVNKSRCGQITYEELCAWMARKLSCGVNMRPNNHLLATCMSLRLPFVLVRESMDEWRDRECVLKSLSDAEDEEY